MKKDEFVEIKIVAFKIIIDCVKVKIVYGSMMDRNMKIDKWIKDKDV